MCLMWQPVSVVLVVTVSVGWGLDIPSYPTGAEMSGPGAKQPHTYIHTYTHKYIHTYIHTYIHAVPVRAGAGFVSCLFTCTSRGTLL